MLTKEQVRTIVREEFAARDKKAAEEDALIRTCLRAWTDEMYRGLAPLPPWVGPSPPGEKEVA